MNSRLFLTQRRPLYHVVSENIRTNYDERRRTPQLKHSSVAVSFSSCAFFCAFVGDFLRERKRKFSQFFLVYRSKHLHRSLRSEPFRRQRKLHCFLIKKSEQFKKCHCKIGQSHCWTRRHQQKARFHNLRFEHSLWRTGSPSAVTFQ